MADISPEQIPHQERISQQDVTELRQFYKDILPVDVDTYQQAGNTDLQAAAAGKIAHFLPNVDPLETEALFYADKIRKLPNSDTIEMTPAARKLFSKIQLLHGMNATADVNTLSPQQAALELAQFVGTRNFSDWSIHSVSIPDGYRGMQAFIQKNNIDLNAVRTEIMESERKRSTEVVLWDIGGVFITNPGTAIVSALSEQLGVSKEQVVEFMEKKDSSTGKLDQSYPSRVPYFRDSPEVMENFWAEIQKLAPGRYIDRNALIAGFEKIKYPDMQAILDEVKQHQRVAVLSDTMPPHLQVLWNFGVYGGFEKVMLSPVIHTTKGIQTEAFNVAIADLGVPPWSIVFVDDSASNVENAKQAHLKTVQFLHTDNPEGVPNLKKELEAEGVVFPSSNSGK